jgi:hypothetical protein
MIPKSDLHLHLEMSWHDSNQISLKHSIEVLNKIIINITRNNIKHNIMNNIL